MAAVHHSICVNDMSAGGASRTCKMRRKKAGGPCVFPVKSRPARKRVHINGGAPGPLIRKRLFRGGKEA